nr:succinate dehydrogenase [ubiquinone] iron-sulfur subunit 3, mitochondrial [Quercus suber]
MSKSWLRHGYNKVSRMVGRADTKKKDFPVLEGHPVGQTHAEQAVETHGTIQSNIKRLMKEFKIYRWNPDHPNNKPYLESHFVDLSNCGPMHRLIEPWLKTRKAPEDGREYRQSPKDRKKLDGFYECILCAFCTTSCPSYWWNPEEFLGPAAFFQAYRWISDCRDDFTDERLQALTEDHRRLYRCRTIKNCTATCPKSLNPAYAIHKMKSKHLLSPPVERIESL